MHTRRGAFSVMAITVVVSRELLFHNSLYGLVNFFMRLEFKAGTCIHFYTWLTNSELPQDVLCFFR